MKPNPPPGCHLWACGFQWKSSLKKRGSRKCQTHGSCHGWSAEYNAENDRIEIRSYERACSILEIWKEKCKTLKRIWAEAKCWMNENSGWKVIYRNVKKKAAENFKKIEKQRGQLAGSNLTMIDCLFCIPRNMRSLLDHIFRYGHRKNCRSSYDIVKKSLQNSILGFRPFLGRWEEPKSVERTFSRDGRKIWN